METIVDYVLRLREGEPHCGGLREHWYEGLRAVGLVPAGAADQVQRLRERADKALVRAESAEAKYEALLAVAKVPAGVLDYANGHRGVGASWFDAADFIRRLADATKPEPPKRKTREEIVEGVLRGVCSADLEPLAREIIAALDASEAP